MQADKLRDLRELVAKATPGPWTVARHTPETIVPASHEGLSLGGSMDSAEDARRFAWPIARMADPCGLPRWSVEQTRNNAALIVAAVNALPELLAIAEGAEADRADARRYRFLKDNGIIRVFPMSSGRMSRGGSRILADTKEWLPGDFTYVIDGKTVDVDAAIDAALAGAEGVAE